MKGFGAWVFRPRRELMRRESLAQRQQWAHELKCAPDAVETEIRRRSRELRDLKLGAGGAGKGVKVDLAHVTRVWRAAEVQRVCRPGEAIRRRQCEWPRHTE